jgi:hypothetical protein
MRAKWKLFWRRCIPMWIGRTEWRVGACWARLRCESTGSVSSRTLVPQVDPVAFKQVEDGRIAVTVHQVVHDIGGKLVVDQIIQHVYVIRDGLIRSMEIR